MAQQQLHGNTQPAPLARLARTGLKRHEDTLLRYVVDYCEKRKYTEAAAALRRESGLTAPSKPLMDSKEGLLYEWWICFWEIYTARLHPDKSANPTAKIYSDSLQQARFGQPRDGSANGRIGGPAAPGTASQTPPGVNGQGPSPSYSTNPSNMNGVQPTSGGAIPGMPAAAVAAAAAAAAANPTLHNPNLQHLQQQQQQRMPGYQPPGPGMPMYQQRPLGAPMGPTGPVPMGPMGTPMQPGRMPNGVVYAQNPNYRPAGVQQSPQQMQDMQTAGASGSPKLAANQDSSPQIQEASRNGGGSFEQPGADAHQQGTPRMQNNRAQKRPSPAEDDSYPKDDSSPSTKRLKRSPQENGPTLPNTPSLAAAQPPGHGRPSGMAAGANGMPLNKTGPGGQFTPTTGPNLSTPMPSSLTNQLHQLNNAHAQRSQSTLQQADQQYFAQLQQTAHATYNIKSASYPPANSLPPGPPSEPPIRGATSAPKGSMLPPPPPGPTNQPTTQPSNGTPGKNTPVPSGLVPRPGGNKDGSSPGGAEGISPESVRPGSRPTLGSTPQMTPSAIPGTTSTPGGPSAISAPSPSQMATPQQISRPQTQSPSSAALGRPPSAPANGLGGGAGAAGATPASAGGTPASAPNPSALLARGFAGNAPPGGGAGGMPGGGPGSQSTPAHSASGMGGSGSMLGGGEPLTSDLFMGLGGNPLSAPFDFQMMGYQEGEGFPSDMNFDLTAGFPMDDSYGMGMYLDDNSLDPVNGP